METNIQLSSLKPGDVFKDPYGVAEVLSKYTGFETSEAYVSVVRIPDGSVTNYTGSLSVVKIAAPSDWVTKKNTLWPSILRSFPYKTYNGADPEIFVMNEKGQVIPAWKFLAKKSLAVENHLPYWDGFQAEFQTTPGTCLNYQNDSTRTGLMHVYNSARQKFPTAELSIANVVKVPSSELLGADDIHVALGCAPSLNAYGLLGTPVSNPRELPYRFAGGHIHRSYPGLLPERARRIVKAVDAILGVPTVAMFEKLDNPLRRKLYGLPGEYRLPRHGLEYRVLSNAWLNHPAIAQFVRTVFRTVCGLADIRMENVFNYQEAEVVETILNCDVDAAKKMVKRNLGQYKALMQISWATPSVRKGLSLLQNPVENFVNPQDIPGNWRFNEAWLSDSGLHGTRWGNF